MSTAIKPGFVDSTIGGLTVTFDGVAAPLLYADPNQITVQVPYEATLGSGKAVVVTNGTASPSSTTVTIAATAPGIFSSDASGIGQAAAVVFSGTTGQISLNSVSSPAHVGDTVSLYLTGEGDYLTAPVAHTGYIVPSNLSPLPQLAAPPVVTIGGTPATVSYAGPVPGSIIGLLQINAVVPTGVTTGAAVPIAVSIGGNSAQTGMTLVIK